MIKVNVAIFERTASDGSFRKLWETTAEVADGTTMVTPVIKPENRGDELFVEVQPPKARAVNYATFRPVTSEEAAAPGAPQVKIASNVYAADCGKVRRVPFSGSMIGISRTGTRPSA